jgi:hypothetical protein
MKRVLAIAMAVLLAGASWAFLGRSLSAQTGFPASAVIRGENIWLRADPAAATDVLTIMQRGDAITITGELTAADSLQFYPIELNATGDVGWVRALFVDPGSIVPIAAPPAEEEPPARRNRDRAAEEPPAAEPAPEEERANRRNRNQQQEEAPPPEEEAQVEAATPAPVEPAPTEVPPAEAPPAEEPPAEEPPVEVVAALAGEGTATTDPFTLEPGRYRVIATLSVAETSGFTAQLRGPNDLREILFEETIDTPQDWTGETNVRIREAGEYTIRVRDTEEAWTIEFAPE